MSALFGMLRFDGRPVAPQDIERGLEVMKPRADRKPRLWHDGSVGLGAALLRVTVEDAWEEQPLRDAETGAVLIGDLRLDDRADLAAALGLAGPDLPRLPDSALVMAAWRRWGADCAAHLRGDFLFVLWDDANRELVIGRDPMGQRSVFCHQNHDRLIFASDKRALWTDPEVPHVLSDENVGRLLIHDLSRNPEGRDGIAGLPGGTVMTVAADGRVTRQTYWRPHADPAHLGKDEGYYVEAYRAVLGEAVSCRLRRLDRQPGLIFSGGYDSAAIAALSAGALSAQGRKLVAVSSTMPADYVGTIRHARRWTECCARDMSHLDLRHVTRENFDPLALLEQEFLLFGRLCGPYHAIEDEMLAVVAGQGCRLVMDGHGGDYTLNPRGFAALPRYLRTGQWLRYLREFPAYVRHSGRPARLVLRDHLAMLVPPSWRFRLKQWKRGGRALWDEQPITDAFARRLMADGVIDPAQLRLSCLDQTRMREMSEGVLTRQVESFAAAGSEQASAQGLFLSRPFHDPRVVELALAVPEDLYVKNGMTRYLARRALRDLYPAEYQDRGLRNDDQIPDFQRMVKRLEPRLLADIARMEQKDYLARMVDFPKIRRLLAARGADDHNSGWEPETQMAMHGYCVARYVEWFRGDNG